VQFAICSNIRARLRLNVEEWAKLLLTPAVFTWTTTVIATVLHGLAIFWGVVCNLLCNIWGRVREMLGLCRVGGWSKNTTLALYIIYERPVASMKLIQCTVCWRVYSWLCQCLARRVINLHASLPRLTQLPDTVSKQCHLLADSKKETWSELVGSTVYHSLSVVCFCVEPGLSASLTESVTVINCPH